MFNASMRKKYIRNCLTVAVFIVIIDMVRSQSISERAPINSYSDNVVLYESNSYLTTGSDHLYTISYPSSYLVSPEVAFALSGYKGNDQLYKQYFAYTLNSVNLNNFIIKIRTESPTSIIYTSISFMVVDDVQEGLEVISKKYTAFSNVSTVELSDRTDILTFQVPFNNTIQYQSHPFITGLHLETVSQVGVSLGPITILDNNTARIDVTASGDMIIKQLYLLFVFIRKPYAGTSNEFEQLYEQSFGQTNILTNYVANYDLNGIFLMGFSGFLLKSSVNTIIKFSWVITNEESGIISFNTYQSAIFGYKFHYIVFLQYSCSNDTFFNLNTHLCMDSCSQLSSLYQTIKICKSCDTLCKTCVNTSNTCSSCFDGYQLSSSNCIQIVNNSNQTNNTNNTNNTNSTNSTSPTAQSSQQAYNSLYLLLLLAIIPILVIIIALICCLRKRKILPQQKFSIKQHPSIEL